MLKKSIFLICMLALSALVVMAEGVREEEAPVDYTTLEFAELAELASGSEVRFYMWGGSTQINEWIDTVVADYLRNTYNISLVRVAMDASVFVNRLLSEKDTGRTEGIMDILWINGENFKNAREGELLYGPFTQLLPNFNDFVDPATAQSDAGFPVDGFEAPYGRAQFVLEYDSAVVPNPPRNFDELAEWVAANPGRFTYPMPPDFTGSAFIRQAFYALTGGSEQYFGDFNESLYEANAATLWDYLNALEPNLWRNGETYPADLATLDGLFERGEVYINMTFTQTGAANKIAQGRYPDTVRTFVLENASISNTHYMAIPFNAPNIPGALVAINGIISPEVQLSKNDPANWGDFTVLDVSKLPANMQAAFADLDLGAATLPLEVLSANAISDAPSAYWEALEEGWEANVLR